MAPIRNVYRYAIAIAADMEMMSARDLGAPDAQLATLDFRGQADRATWREFDDVIETTFMVFEVRIASRLALC
jgi:hypothetical protein